ncbi:hypothetical protein ELLBI42_07130 [Enterobacter ludwigii]|nr:hypothetical protein ELLBI42_07130 [Enterobacter ludwigii]QDE49483.1 hypothetical protein ECI140_07130 [Enterobacter ludwigii]
MDSHDPKRISTGRGRQNWRAFRPVMRLHENHYTKRAGVAGIRARKVLHFHKHSGLNFLKLGGHNDY